MKIMLSVVLLWCLGVSPLYCETSPDIDDLNQVRIEAEKKLKSGPISEDEKQELQRILRYVDTLSLFKKGDDAIREKFPDAVILTTEKTKGKFFLVKDHEKKEQIIAIRGSANLKNWIINFSFWKIKDMWLKIRLHKGFYQMSRGIFWKVVFHLDPEYSTTVSGHSLGGACAAILGMYLDNFGHKDVKVLSFGQSRVTNKSGTKPFAHLPYTRVAVKRDIVTHLPPKWLFYRHFGKKFLLRKADFGWVDEDEMEDPPEAMEEWEKWTKDHDENDTPTLEPPLAAQLWMNLRPTEAPSNMKSLFSSTEWKQLAQMVQKSEQQGIHHSKKLKPQRDSETEDEQSSNEDWEIVLPKPVSGGLGDWFRYHNLEEYHKRVLKMIEDFPETSEASVPNTPPPSLETPVPPESTKPELPRVDRKKPSRFYLPFLVQ